MIRKPRLFSLKWQVSLGFGALLIALLSISSATALWRLENQIERNRVEAQELRSELFAYINSLLIERLTVYTETMMLRSGEDEISTEQLISKINDYWQAQSLLLDLEAAWLFDANGELLQGWGGRLFPHADNLLKRVIKEMRPSTMLHCERDCSHLIALPLYDRSRPGVLVISMSLMDSVIALRNIHEANRVNIGVMTRVDEAAEFGMRGLPRWRVKVHSLSSFDKLWPVLQAASERLAFADLLQSGQTISHEGATYLLWAMPVDDQDSLSQRGFLLFIDDVSEQQVLTASTYRNALASAVIVLLLGLIGVSVMTTAVTSRIRRLSLSLPQIARQRFTEARGLMERKTYPVYDELSVLEDSSVDLIDQLETLNLQVETHTRQLERMAMFDELTDLPNRNQLMRFMHDGLAEYAQAGIGVALVFIDLDNFKRINETLGHDAGDKLLRVVGKRLNTMARQTDLLGRFGGDEFMLILTGLSDRESVHQVIRELFRLLKRPVNVMGKALVSSASIGVAYCDQPGVGADELVKQADTALYKAKESGRNQYRFFDSQMFHQVSRQLALDSELRRAVRKREFCLFMQPQVELATTRLIGFEALIRWRHPEKGLMFPDAFIEELEHSEHIVQVGYWTIGHCMSLLKDLAQRGYPDLKIAVNLSSRQFSDPRLADVIYDNLRKYGLHGSQIELELTENTLIGDMQATIQKMEQLRALGVSIAIDDFGTGFSSLDYLRRLPVDLLKIDRSFVMELDQNDTDQKLVTTILAMADNLNVEVVAEGIENAAHLQFLTGHGCHYGQGYFLSRPIDDLKLYDELSQRYHEGKWR